MNKAIEETRDQIIIPENEILDYLISKDYVKSNWYNHISSSFVDMEELLKELKESCFDQIHKKYKDYGIIVKFIYYIILYYLYNLKKDSFSIIIIIFCYKYLIN